MAVDWTQLPPDLLESISKNLTIYADYIRFRSVCHNWQSSIPPIPHHLPPQLPWLMLPQSQSCQSNRRAFFSFFDNKAHFLNLPEASYRNRRCGSSHGWLLILDESPNVFLLNPVTRGKIDLPPLTTFPNVVGFNFSEVGREYLLQSCYGNHYSRDLRQMRDGFIKKVVLSSSPMNDCGFVVVVILSQTSELVYCKNGDERWSFIDKAHSYSEDVIYCDGLFYAVNRYGGVAVCDLHSSCPKVSILEMERRFEGDMHYLVNSGDEKFLVTRYLDISYEVEPDQLNLVYRTRQFEVFKLDWKGPRWERVRNLGDRMLFLGENSSFALLASDFPGCVGNCIYYTDDYSESNYEGAFGEHDLGIFKLQDGSIDPLSCYPRYSHSRLCWPPPVWISPNPW